ncbi:MAG: phage portal protein [Pseudobutyrivibrio sp.]|nr:phage portal protein [Pseudobutyrivibrio sp.]
MELNISVGSIEGLPEEERKNLGELIEVYKSHQSKNSDKEKYYNGAISLRDVNIGIALPDDLSRLELGCEWGTKAVDVLAARSMFDGFVGEAGKDNEILNQISKDNGLVAHYNAACKDELKFGCTFATLSADQTIKCKIKFHSPQTAAALWDGEKNRIRCGFAIIDTVEDESKKNTYVPSHINYYTDNAIFEIVRENGNSWIAQKKPHKMGRPLMVAMIWNATSSKPFGRSRIKRTVRSLVDAHIRTIANATIGLEFATSPQKYLLGVTDDQYDAIVNNKFKTYVGSLLAATNNPETGDQPKFGQLAQGTLQPHIDMMRMLATQFAAETGLSVTDTGVINDANPTSSDAILAQSQTLVGLAEQLNAGNGDALRTIARMALAIAENKKLDELDDSADVIARFKNPAMPNVASTTDAAIKIAGAREGFATTDVFLEMIGFSKADVARIKAQEQRARGLALVGDMDDIDDGE